ncbi:quinoprotein dehydrogenase-associated putative ABC transporter substrate-binding protein [Hyphomicrobium sp. NDB2Meth4]|uniref:quinoprotein dehydrogenase-associated putative ABC transporter substrate-binding protein n=1 Tax=Hyphomicrobium sp. NDB2Meth4 TaxID=1892846 RepID=UPI001FCD1BD0|nr:quinoprotein dehydrogenase-associated putative ABC transporter substrate-binding protein [Hyphomicrobium sp. NDB2Meth4]
MVKSARALLLAAVVASAFIVPAQAARDAEKEYDELTAAEKTAAKRAGKEMFEKKTLGKLNVCADPGNMPFSNIAREGYQNKIAEVIAKAMGADLIYFWRPYLERGLTRETFETNMCDVLLDLPADYALALTTFPIYRTAYVFAYRADRGYDFKGFDDPKLKDLKIGVFQTSGVREVLTKRGLAPNLKLHTLSHNADLQPENQPWRQVQDVVDGKLDVAAVWGPFAGWVQKMRGEPIVVQPVNLWEDYIPLEFDLSIGVRKRDAKLKYALEYALEATKPEIEKILTDYGVPLVQCSRCLIQGTLPAHGGYTVLPNSVFAPKPEKATPDQVVTQEKVEHWLDEGADPTQELANAVLAADVARIKFLVSKGADINARDPQGYAPVHTAARNRHPELISALADLGADLNAPDSDGMTPLIHAAMRNHVPTVKMLLERGADIERANAQGYSPLALSIAENKFEVAKALMEAGAAIDKPAGPEGLTPLMVAVSQVSPGEGGIFLPGSTRPIDVARELITRGANVNAQTEHGVTPLMIAAARNVTPMIGLLLQSKADPAMKSKEGKTALQIAEQNGSEQAAKALRVIGRVGEGGSN